MLRCCSQQDSGDDKKNLVLSLGAEAWIDFKETQDLVGDIKRITGGLGAHSAVVTTASPSGYTQAVDYLRPGGTLMAVGLPGTAKLEASIFFTVLKSISIIGSYVGYVPFAFVPEPSCVNSLPSIETAKILSKLSTSLLVVRLRSSSSSSPWVTSKGASLFLLLHHQNLTLTGTLQRVRRSRGRNHCWPCCS